MCFCATSSGRDKNRHFCLLDLVNPNPFHLLLSVLSAAWVVQKRHYSAKEEESPDQFDSRWEAYFNDPQLDSWALKRGVNELYGHDLVPEPKIVVAMLKAARRVNDIAMAIRILEAVKDKAAGDATIYKYIIESVKPTLDELGVSTPEELGLDKA